ncbi:MAG TPA: SPOR domain-containing protein [Rhodanobacteraceae bacterium]|nr:SPOR domain-containing protein [Rhodanobacteraceae bacterium]
MASKRGNGRQAVRSNGGVPGWILFGAGLVVGVILCAIVVWGGYAPSLRRHDQPQPNPQATAPPASAPGIADQTAKDTSKPTFDFYSVLPEKEVVIPDAQLSAQAKAEQRSAAAANNASPSTGAPSQGAAASSGYLLQVGSFPSSADADSMKAKLALQGFTASVQPVTINGQTWHRVRLGPFASATDLESAKQRLSTAGIHAIALKEK